MNIESQITKCQNKIDNVCIESSELIMEIDTEINTN